MSIEHDPMVAARSDVQAPYSPRGEEALRVLVLYLLRSARFRPPRRKPTARRAEATDATEVTRDEAP